MTMTCWPRQARYLVRRISLILALGVLSLLAGASRAEASLKRAIRQLEEGKPEAALSTLTKLLERAGPSVAPGRENLRSLGATLLYRAVAEYELEQFRDARWSWQMAKQFFPEIEGMDLSSLGAAAGFLRSQTVVEPEITLDARAPGQVPPEDLKAPVKIHAPAPVYGMGARSAGIEGTVLVWAVVREDGTLDDPRIVEPWPAPSLVYSTLEALREWRFRPAERSGAPIQILYLLWINFELR